MRRLLAIAALLVLAAPALAQVPPYDRDRFGTRWIDADHDCQDTRSEALRLAGPTTGKCRVVLIRFTDLYTRETYSGPARRIDIDHLVPLAEAWRSGAWAWTDEQRTAFANDLAGLVPTDYVVNRSKGDRDPAEWLPPSRDAWCWYGRAWIAVKGKYRLSMDGEEVAAVARALATCEVTP